MNIFFEPLNINQWNIFEKVEKVGHLEPFLATNDMHIGDLVLFHVGQQNKEYISGIYAVGEIVEGPFVLKNHPNDYCNNKNTVIVKITKINYFEPFIARDDCRTLFNQFRTVHKINDSYYGIILKKIGSSSDLTIIENIENGLSKISVEGLEKTSLVKVRINQSVFRERLLQKYKHCCLCKVEQSTFLRASHIKPWAASSPKEKLDDNNGFLLCPNHDTLFDSGFISFEDNGSILISESLSETDRIFMNVNPSMKIDLTEENKTYLDYHRKNIFKK